MRILIVEDEPIAAMSAMSELERAGHEVVGPAASLQDALQLAQECKPELALVDIDLNEAGEGVRVARTLRDLGVASIFVSAQTRVAHDNRHLALGYIGKPYDASDLIRCVDAIDAVLRGDEPPSRSIPTALRLFS